MSAALDPSKHLPWKAPCAKCRHLYDYADLDGKPEPTFWLWLIELFRGQHVMLTYAADHGHDFTRFECAKCYGPEYVALPPEAAR